MEYVHLRENSKKPTGSRWEIGDEEKREIWLDRGDNVGTLTQRNNLEIWDFDEKEPAREFYKLHRPILSTIVETKRGVHFYFKGKGGKTQKFEYGDIKRTGYCVTPGSHVDGFEYKAIQEDWSALQEAPQIITPEQVRKEVYESVNEPSLVNRITRARLYLLKIPPAVKGERHTRAFYVACKLVQFFDLDPMTAWPLLLEWNDRCLPPLDMSIESERKQLFRKLTEAERLKC